jgi:hypothetical protein
MIRPLVLGHTMEKDSCQRWYWFPAFQKKTEVSPCQGISFKRKTPFLKQADIIWISKKWQMDKQLMKRYSVGIINTLRWLFA